MQKELRRRRGRPGVARALAESPDHLVEARLDACPACQASFADQAQTPQGVHDRTELPPVRPDVVFRKVANGFRAKRGAQTYAAFRSVVSTARTRGETVLAAVQHALRGQAACAPG